MKATIFEGIRSIGLGERPDPVIKAPNDAIVLVEQKDFHTIGSHIEPLQELLVAYY